MGTGYIAMDLAKLDWEIDFKGRAIHIPAKRDCAIYMKAFYFISSKGQRCFYIKTSKEDIEFISRLSSLGYQYDDNNNMLEVICKDPSFHETFDILFMESFELMNNEKTSFSYAYGLTIEKYRAFLLSETFLPVSEQIGLLNELVFLKLVLQKNRNGLKYWIDMDEDFKFGNIYVELKATRSKIHKHIINGLAQLTVLPGTKKYLASSLVIDLAENSTSQSTNLYDTTKEIIELIQKDKRRKLLDRLNERGYFHELKGVEYKAFNYDIYETNFVEVDESFPCINLSSLEEPLYNYVDPQKIQYELDLSGLMKNFNTVDSAFVSQLLQKL